MSSPAQIASILKGVVQRGKYQAMQRAVLVVEAQAKREAPVKRGTLRRSITSRVERGGDRGVIGTNLRYARPVHEGSKKHIIRPRRAKALYWKGARHPVKFVRHPGNRANPFLRRAADRSRASVERELQAWGTRVLASVK
jgi:hypothetical protein